MSQTKIGAMLVRDCGSDFTSLQDMHAARRWWNKTRGRIECGTSKILAPAVMGLSIIDNYCENQAYFNQWLFKED